MINLLDTHQHLVYREVAGYDWAKDIPPLATDNFTVEDYNKLRPSNIEFKLPQPNYTVNTLVHISEKHPEKEFCLIMGEDNLKSFHKWKNYETILEHHDIYVYPRVGGGKVKNQFRNHPKIHRVNAPVIQISATLIRDGIKNKKNVEPMLPSKVWKYIDEMNFYRK